jgi:hypothetical protein
MTIPNIRNALESALASISPAVDIVHENQSYNPTADQPYCEAYLLVATPNNPTMGDGFYQESGIFQVNLQYPPEVGTLDAALQAERIRALFRRGATFSDGGVSVMVDRTAEIGAGRIEAGLWMTPIKIRWHSDLYT